MDLTLLYRLPNMKLDYSQTVNNWFKNYPRSFKMTCGPSIVNLGGPWVNGSQIILVKTPLSDVHQGTYYEGHPPPDYKVIYSDTGLDDDFTIKYIESGWGSFTYTDTEDNYWLEIEKYCELWSGYTGVGKFFKKVNTYYTQIPKSTLPYGPNTPTVAPIPIEYDFNTWAQRFGHPVDIDQSRFANNLILTYGKFTIPQIPYIVGQPMTVTSYQVALTPLMNSWTAIVQPFEFYLCWNLFTRWSVYLFAAPDRYGIYALFMYVDWNTYQWVIDYAFLWTSLMYGGQDIMPLLRDAAFRQEG